MSDNLPIPLTSDPLTTLESITNLRASSTPAKRLSKAAEPIRIAADFVIEAFGEEVKKLPGGSILVAVVKMLSGKLGEKITEEKDDPNAPLFEAIAKTHDDIELLLEFSRTLFAQQYQILQAAKATNFDVSADQLTEIARQTALFAYKAAIARKYRDIDRRPLSQRQLEEHITLLPLDDIYIVPNLVADSDWISDKNEEQQRLNQLEQDGDYISAELRSKLERETNRMRRWERGLKGNSKTLGDALRSVRHAVVLGLPGTGKTTMTQYIARGCALGEEEMQARFGWSEDTTPLLISLAAFASHRINTKRPNLPITDFIDHLMNEQGGEPLYKVIQEEIKADRIFLLLDGVDEVPDDNGREMIVRAAEEFIEQHEQVRCLVTSRPAGYKTVRGALPHLTLPNFNEEQVKDFIQRWRRALEKRGTPDDPNYRDADNKADALLKEIHSNRYVKELATNPLLLVILTLLHIQGTRLPERRIDLYERIVEMLAEKWNTLRSMIEGVSPSEDTLNVEELIETLGAVAEWTRREKPRGVLHRDELQYKMETIIRERFPDYTNPQRLARTYLNAAANRSGLLTECGHDYFMFWHSTFEEYLTARELANPASCAKDRLLPLRSDPRYREVILLAVAHIGKRERTTALDLVRAIREDQTSPLEPILHTNLLLATDCLIDRVTNGLVKQELEVLKQFIRILSDQPFEQFIPSFRRLVHTLVPGWQKSILTSYPEILVALETLLGHQFWEIRMESLRLIGSITATNPKAKEICYRYLLDADDDVCRMAAWGLLQSSEITDKIWIKFLSTSFGDQITQIETPDSQLTTLMDLSQSVIFSLLSSDNENIRLQVSDLYVKASQGEKATEALVSLLTSNNHLVRSQAAELLTKAGLEKNTIEALLPLFASDSFFVRSQASELFFKVIRGEKATEALVSLLTSDNENVRLQAAELLVKASQGEKATEALVSLLTSDNKIVRLQAAELLVQKGLGEKAIKAIASLLTSDNENIRLQAAELLVKASQGEKATETIVALLASDSIYVRLQAARLLVQEGLREKATEALVSLLASDDENVRLQAAELLVQEGLGEKATGTIVALLASDSIYIRLQASRLLVKASLGEKATETLVSLLASDDENARLQAAELLVQEGLREKAFETIVTLLASDSIYIRSQASRLLVKASLGEKATEALVSLLTSDNENVSLQASLLLFQEGMGEKTTEALLSLLTSDSVYIRSQAAELLVKEGIGEKTTEALVSLLANDSINTRTQAAELIIKVGESDTVGSLVQNRVILSLSYNEANAKDFYRLFSMAYNRHKMTLTEGEALANYMKSPEGKEVLNNFHESYRILFAILWNRLNPIELEEEE